MSAIAISPWAASLLGLDRVSEKSVQADRRVHADLHRRDLEVEVVVGVGGLLHVDDGVEDPPLAFQVGGVRRGDQRRDQEIVGRAAAERRVAADRRPDVVDRTDPERALELGDRDALGDHAGIGREQLAQPLFRPPPPVGRDDPGQGAPPLLVAPVAPQGGRHPAGQPPEELGRRPLRVRAAGSGIEEAVDAGELQVAARGVDDPFQDLLQARALGVAQAGEDLLEGEQEAAEKVGAGAPGRLAVDRRQEVQVAAQPVGVAHRILIDTGQETVIVKLQSTSSPAATWTPVPVPIWKSRSGGLSKVTPVTAATSGTVKAAALTSLLLTSRGALPSGPPRSGWSSGRTAAWMRCRATADVTAEPRRTSIFKRMGRKAVPTTIWSQSSRDQGR